MDESRPRVFKSKQFAKLAGKAGISDSELCKAFLQVFVGQCEDLGGGVLKKRIAKNLYRSILLEVGGKFWFFIHLYAKKDIDNIDDATLKEYKRAAAFLETKTTKEIETYLSRGGFMELKCHDKNKKPK